MMSELVNSPNASWRTVTILAGSLLLVSNHLQVLKGTLGCRSRVLHVKNDVKSFFHEMVQHDHFIPAQNAMFFMFDLRSRIDFTYIIHHVNSYGTIPFYNLLKLRHQQNPLI